MIIVNSNKLDALVLRSRKECLRHQHLTPDVHDSNERLDEVLILHRLECDKLPVPVRQELARREPVLRVEVPDPHGLDNALEVLVHDDDEVRAPLLVLLLVVDLGALAAGHEVPLAVHGVEARGLVDEVPGEGRVGGLPHGLVHAVPVEVGYAALGVDPLDPLVVEVDDLALGRRPLLADGADVHGAVLDGGPLVLLALLRAAVALHEDVGGDGHAVLDVDLADNARAVVEREELVVEVEELGKLHCAAGLVELGAEGDGLLLELDRVAPRVGVAAQRPEHQVALPAQLPVVLLHLGGLVLVGDGGYPVLGGVLRVLEVALLQLVQLPGLCVAFLSLVIAVVIVGWLSLSVFAFFGCGREFTIVAGVAGVAT